MEIFRDRVKGTLKISQQKYVRDILERYKMSDCKGKNIPLTPGADLAPLSDSDEPANEHMHYAECIGSLMYLCSFTRPDISLAVSMLARHMGKPGVRHWNYLKHVLQYLSSTMSLGITYGTENAELQGFCDSDYAACKATRKSRGGFGKENLLLIS